MEQITNLVNANTADVLFYIFAGLTLLCAVMVIANPFSRNPVTSAMFLVLTIISMTGLFLLLHAFFLAAVQIIVYAGAVLVLFVFVIMLLDLKEEERRAEHEGEQCKEVGLVASPGTDRERHHPAGVAREKKAGGLNRHAALTK